MPLALHDGRHHFSGWDCRFYRNRRRCHSYRTQPARDPANGCRALGRNIGAELLQVRGPRLGHVTGRHPSSIAGRLHDMKQEVPVLRLVHRRMQHRQRGPHGGSAPFAEQIPQTIGKGIENLDVQQVQQTYTQNTKSYTNETANVPQPSL